MAYAALFVGCNAGKNSSPIAKKGVGFPAGFVPDTNKDAAPPEPPEGEGFYRNPKERQEFIDMGDGSWWCVRAVEKHKPISWCGWGPKSVAESQAKDWRTVGVPGDTTNVRVVEAKRIYFIEVFDKSSFKSANFGSSWAIDLAEAREAAKHAEAMYRQVRWHLFTRSEYWDACYDLPACR